MKPSLYKNVGPERRIEKIIDYYELIFTFLFWHFKTLPCGYYIGMHTPAKIYKYVNQLFKLFNLICIYFISSNYLEKVWAKKNFNLYAQIKSV